MAAVEGDDYFAGGDATQGFGELGTGDSRLGQRVIGGIDGVDWQQVLARAGSGFDAAAVAGDVEEDRAIGRAGCGHVGQGLPDGSPCGFTVEEQADVTFRVSAVQRIDQQIVDVLRIGKHGGWQLVDLRVVGDPDDDRMSVLKSCHLRASSLWKLGARLVVWRLAQELLPFLVSEVTPGGTAGQLHKLVQPQVPQAGGVVLQLPVTSQWPSGLMARALMLPSCPRRTTGLAAGSWALRSHRRAVLSRRCR